LIAGASAADELLPREPELCASAMRQRQCPSAIDASAASCRREKAKCGGALEVERAAHMWHLC